MDVQNQLGQSYQGRRFDMYGSNEYLEITLLLQGPDKIQADYNKFPLTMRVV